MIGHEREQADRDDGQRPPTEPDVDQEQDRAGDRDHHQDPERGQLRVHVRVGGADHDPTGGGQQVELPEVVAPRLDEHDQAQEHRHVRLDLRRHLVDEARRLRPDPAPEVVRERGQERHADQRREQPPLHELQPRQREHVEGGIAPEQRLGVPERQPGAVAPQQVRLPLGRDPQPHEDRDHQREQRQEPADVGLELHPVALDDLLLGRQRVEARRDATDDPQVREQEHEEREPERDPEQDLGPEDRPEHRGEVDLAEPQDVDEEPRERGEGDEETGHHRDDDDDEPTPSRRGCCCRNAYDHRSLVPVFPVDGESGASLSPVLAEDGSG